MAMNRGSMRKQITKGPMKKKVGLYSKGKRVRTAKKGGVMKVQKAGLGLLMLMNQMKKEGKKAGRKQAQLGEMQQKQNMGMNEDMDNKEAEGMNMGGFADKPMASGSYLKQDIDGDESFTNPSAQAYYKGMLD